MIDISVIGTSLGTSGHWKATKGVNWIKHVYVMCMCMWCPIYKCNIIDIIYNLPYKFYSIVNFRSSEKINTNPYHSFVLKLQIYSKCRFSIFYFQWTLNSNLYTIQSLPIVTPQPSSNPNSLHKTDLCLEYHLCSKSHYNLYYNLSLFYFRTNYQNFRRIFTGKFSIIIVNCFSSRIWSYIQ